jgi:hypothetical protein
VSCIAALGCSALTPCILCCASSACPVIASLWDRYSRLFGLILGVAGFVALVYITLTLGLWAGGSDFRVRLTVRPIKN